jgi:urocanate hydratase
LALNPAPATFDSSQLEANAFYCALTRSASLSADIDSDGKPSLGGKLLYAGEFEARGRALVIAGNVAGCATLAASADAAAQKQSIHEGVADFLVNSLDEALRILKNEIRTRKTVAVCVGVSPDLIEQEMQERGVRPDLVFAGQRTMLQFGAGSSEVRLIEPDSGRAFLTWRVEQAAARWMPKVDAVALERLGSDSWEHRWIRLSPRYLGRVALAERALFCDPVVAKEIISGIGGAVRDGEIGVEVVVSLRIGDDSKVIHMPHTAMK